MFCENCGAEYNRNDKFCGSCGHPLEPAPVGQPEAAQQLPSSSYVDTPPESNYTQNSENTQEPYRPDRSEIYQQPYPNTQGYSGYQSMGNQSLPVRKKTSPFVPIIVFEVLLLVGLLYFAFRSFQESYGPENVSKRYFVSMVNGDYQKAFSMLNIDKDSQSEFINPDSFRTYVKSMGLSKVANFKYDKNYSKDYLFEKDKKNDISRRALITYVNKGETSERSYELNLIKNDKKKFLLFDNWNISFQNMICDNVKVDVSEGAELKIDGIKVSESFLGETEYGVDSYYIPSMFAGSHHFEVTKDGMEPEAMDMEIYGDGNNVSIYNRYLTKKEAEKLENLVVDNMKLVYESALDEKDFRAVQSIFLGNHEYEDEIKYRYDDLVTNLNGSYRTVEKIEFDNIVTTMRLDNASVYLSYDYKLYYTYTNSWTGEILQDTAEGNNTAEINFLKMNGQWLQSDFGYPGFSNMW